MTPPAALILAGGRGERLGGVIKANLQIGGWRLLDRVAAVLAPHAAPLLVAHGAVAAADLALTHGQIAVPDLLTDYAGPLAGLAGGLAWIGEHRPDLELLVTLAVDSPFVPADFVPRLATALGPGAAAVASYGGQPYPTNALWRIRALADLPARVAAGTAPRSLRRLALELEVAAVEWPPQPAGDPFANANTPADLVALEARAAAGDGA
jgi:molybdopterin-guanine dinucleotide biosynthesis protein A